MDIKEKIAQANEKTVHMLMDSDPVWVDMKPAIECVDGLEDHMILHSGPPIAYEDMTMLHKRGMVSAMLFEGWAKDEEEAVKRLKAGEIKISSALDHNTVGAGTGIITKSVVLNVVEDRHNHTVAATFPAEGPFQGGFCGWGLYSKEIAENLRYMARSCSRPWWRRSTSWAASPSSRSLPKVCRWVTRTTPVRLPATTFMTGSCCRHCLSWTDPRRRS